MGGGCTDGQAPSTSVFSSDGHNKMETKKIKRQFGSREVCCLFSRPVAYFLVCGITP